MRSELPAEQEGVEKPGLGSSEDIGMEVVRRLSGGQGERSRCSGRCIHHIIQPWNEVWTLAKAVKIPFPN